MMPGFASVGAAMLNAVNVVRYDAAIKIGLQFKRRFWEQDEHIFGGISYTDLPTLLHARDVETLILCGLSTSGVVLSTIRHAADADYNIVVLEDACADHDPEVHRMLMTKVFPSQAEIMTVQNFLKAIA